MASQTRETHDEELNKILNKAFDDIRRRVSALVAKREKKLLRDMKISSKKPREPEQPKKKDKDKEYKRSKSSSSDSN